MAALSETIQSVSVIVRPGPDLGQVVGEDEELMFTIDKLQLCTDNPAGPRAATAAKMSVSIADLFSPTGSHKISHTTLRKPDGYEDCRYYLTQNGSSHSLTFAQKEIGDGAIGLTVLRNSDGALTVDACLLTYPEREVFSRVAQPSSWTCTVQ